MASDHVLAVISGWSLRVIPRAPFRAVRGASPRELLVEHASLSARITADGAGGFRSEPDGDALGQVVDVERGPVAGAWMVETHAFRAALPDGFALHSAPPGSPSPFDLVGPASSLIYVQSPSRMPPIEAMCGPGQRVSGRGDTWIELEYGHDGVRWWQRHEVVGRLVFTAQATVESREAASDALKRFVASLVA